MCGRIFQTHNLQRLIQIARTSNLRNGNLHNPSFNSAPTNYIPAVRQRTLAQRPRANETQEKISKDEKIQKEEQISNEKPGQKDILINKEHQENALINKEQIPNEREDLELDFLKWGYDAGFAFVINARIEELQEKKMFKNLLNTNRCAVIAEGYYEWNEKKEPFSFKPTQNADHFYIAALYFGNDTVILLTRPSIKSLEGVHHRMPVLLEGNELDLWLDNEKSSFSSIIDNKILNDKNEVWGKVRLERVGPFVNDAKNKTQKCLMSYADYMKELDEKGIKRFFKPKTPGTEGKKQENIGKLEEKNGKKDIQNEKNNINKEKEEKKIDEEEKSPKIHKKTPEKRKEDIKDKGEVSGEKHVKTVSKSAVNQDEGVVDALKAFINN